jgi:hypothetical protein
MRLRAQHLSFWLHISSNTPFVHKGYCNSVLLPLTKECHFLSCKSRLEKRLGELAQFKTRLQFWQLVDQSKWTNGWDSSTRSKAQLVRKSWEGLLMLWCGFFRLRAVMFRWEVLGPRISKDGLTNGVMDIAKPSRGSDTKVCHMMDQGAQKKRWIEWTKFDIGFKDMTIWQRPTEWSIITRLSRVPIITRLSRVQWTWYCRSVFLLKVKKALQIDAYAMTHLYDVAMFMIWYMVMWDGGRCKCYGTSLLDTCFMPLNL